MSGNPHLVFSLWKVNFLSFKWDPILGNCDFLKAFGVHGQSDMFHVEA